MRDWHVFYVKISENFENVFRNFFSQKLENRFLVESTKTENASFPYKTAMSESNVMTNKVVSTNWTNHKERSNYFIFLKIWFQFKNLLIKSCFDVPATQMSIFLLLVCVEILFEDDFSQ